MIDKHAEEVPDGNGWLVPSWVAYAKSTCHRLAGELNQARGQDPSPEYRAIHQTIEEAIKQAQYHAQRPRLIVRNRPFRRLRSLSRRLSDWWTGSEVDQVWAALHTAGQALLAIQSPAAVKSQLADMAATVVTALDPGDLGGSGTGAVSAGCGSVSSPRPSNRACGSPAHGLPTFFTGGVRPSRASPGRAGAG